LVVPLKKQLAERMLSIEPGKHLHQEHEHAEDCYAPNYLNGS
jgi:hypothetical protein